MLTIKKPSELAEDIVYNSNGERTRIISTEEGDLFVCIRGDGTDTLYVKYDTSNDTDVDDVIDAYANALIYELERLTGGPWIIR